MNRIFFYLITVVTFIFLFYSCIPTPIVPLCENLEQDEGELGIDCGGDTGCEPCHLVDASKELLIKHLSVVDSEEATSGDLSFQKLIERLNPEDSKGLILSLIQSWEESQITNGISVAPRSAVTDKIKELWMQRDGATSEAEWEMNLENAPFRLLAITNRVDLNDLPKKAGEGRLTFGLAENGANTFTLIFEYKLAGSNQKDLVRWAKRWHVLSKLDKESQEYRDTLTNIVNSFSSDASMLGQLRTNEVLGGFQDGTFNWELREFNIEDGRFIEVTRKQSITSELNNTPELKEYLEAHAEDILNGTIHERFDERSILAGNALYGGNFRWQLNNAEGFAEELDHMTAASCVGCHGGHFPGTGFTHIKPRAANIESRISPFLGEDLLGRRNTATVILGQPVVRPLMLPFPHDSTAITLAEQMELKKLVQKLKSVKRVH